MTLYYTGIMRNIFAPTCHGGNGQHNNHLTKKSGAWQTKQEDPYGTQTIFQI